MKRDGLGAVLWILCLQYFAAEAITVAGWRGVYSFSSNYISDLGALGCSAALCSPLHALMNGSFLLQGGLIVGGAALLWPSLAEGIVSSLAMVVIGASGIGVFLVGLAPEDALPAIHYFGAAENFLCCHLGMATMGVSFLRRGAPAIGGISLTHFRSGSRRWGRVNWRGGRNDPRCYAPRDGRALYNRRHGAFAPPRALPGDHARLGPLARRRHHADGAV